MHVSLQTLPYHPLATYPNRVVSPLQQQKLIILNNHF